jgi:PST family polysaccharide transporter
MSKFKLQTISGIKWGLLNNLIIQIFNMAVSVVLARLLLPEDFGKVGMVMVITGFASVFFEMGFGHALIQKENLTDEDTSSVFWFNVIAGALLAVAMFMLSNQIAFFYTTPIVGGLAKLLALVFVFNSMNVVQFSLLKKAINFKKIAFVNVTSTVVSGILAIVLALMDFKIWAIALQILSLSFFKTLFYWLSSNWRPKLIFEMKAIKSMLGFSSSVTADSIITYWARNLDNLLIGKFEGGDALGLYTKAYSIMMLPLHNISQVLTNVLFPSFSTIKNDKSKLKSVQLRIQNAVILVVLPFCCLIWLSAHELVVILFGNNWLGMVPLVKILTFLGITQSLLKINGSLYLALGKAQLAFKLSLIFQLFALLLLGIGLWLNGLYGLVIGYAVASLIVFFPSFYFSGRLIQLSIAEFLKKSFPILLSGAIMLLTVIILEQVNVFNFHVVFSLFIKTFIGLGVYTLCLVVFRVQLFYELITLVKSQLKRKK